MLYCSCGMRVIILSPVLEVTGLWQIFTSAKQIIPRKAWFPGSAISGGESSWAVLRIGRVFGSLSLCVFVWRALTYLTLSLIRRSRDEKNKKAFAVISEILLWPLFLQAIIFCICELFRPLPDFFHTHLHDFYWEYIQLTEEGIPFFFTSRLIWTIAFVYLFFRYLSRRAQISKFRFFFAAFVLSAIPMILMRILLEYYWVIHPLIRSPYQDILPFLTSLFDCLYVITALWSLACIIFSVKRMATEA